MDRFSTPLRAVSTEMIMKPSQAVTFISASYINRNTYYTPSHVNYKLYTQNCIQAVRNIHGGKYTSWLRRIIRRCVDDQFERRKVF